MSLTGTTSVTSLADGTPAFQKELSQAPEGFFDVESAGLHTLAAIGVRAPRVFHVTDNRLLMQLIDVAPTAQPTAAQDATFGLEVARLHLAGQFGATPEQTYGALEGLTQGYLGAAAIDLTPTRTLHESFVLNRIIPLTRQAIDAGHLDPAALPLAEAITPEHLGPVEPPTIIHGDLWSGNRVIDTAGDSWLVDPSCHWGHREQDIAMMQLFGGFSQAVFDAYLDAFPLADGWQQRIPTFQLVPLLVHTLLFGASYAEATMRAFTETVAR